MTDPAVEAAQRAFDNDPVGCQGITWAQMEGDNTYVQRVAAAREALKPIQEWHERAGVNAIAEDLYDQIDLLEELAPLIYTSEELEG